MDAELLQTENERLLGIIHSQREQIEALQKRVDYYARLVDASRQQAKRQFEDRYDHVPYGDNDDYR